MRSGLLALRAAGAVAVLVATPALGAVTARAHDSVRVTVTPSAVAPGGEIEIRAEGCGSGSGAAGARVFVAEAELKGGAGGALTGSTVIGPSVKEGRYEVDVRCDGHGHAGAGGFDVVAGAGSHERQDSPAHHASPVAPVRAGGGGAAPLAADAPDAHARDAHDARDVRDVRDAHEVQDVRDVDTDTRTAAEATGPGMPHAVIGLVLAGVAAVAVALRSARRSRHSERDSD
ncbi:hypothetical protein ACFRMN_19840 [Streptomyces sp. NPDC056835]|uniref:hypothetical protein n=1 Tax=Streptomyces sp. NPDC056835 TaxID=3345956 RepID=UPI0036BE07A8